MLSKHPAPELKTTFARVSGATFSNLKSQHTNRWECVCLRGPWSKVLETRPEKIQNILLAMYSPSPFTTCRLLCRWKGASELTRRKKLVVCLHKTLQKWPNIIYAELKKLFSMWTDTQVRTVFGAAMTENSNPVFPSIFSVSILQAHRPLKQVMRF